MAILEKTAPNGQIIEFDTNEFSDQEMEQYLNLPKFKKELPQVNQEQEETSSRNMVTDIGLSVTMFLLLVSSCCLLTCGNSFLNFGRFKYCSISWSENSLVSNSII